MFDVTQTGAIKFLAMLLIFGGGIFGLTYYMNQSMLVLHGEIPYTVSVFGGQEEFCNIDPCVIDLEKGEHAILAAKEGYKNHKFDVSLGMRDRVEVDIDFELVPFVEEISKEEGDEIFQPEIKPAIELRQEKGHKQALYVEGEAVAFFSMPMENYELKFLDDGKTVAITEHGDKDTVYLVDTKGGTRSKLVRKNREITGLSCSYDVKWCLLESDEMALINVETGEELKHENLDVALSQTVWSKEGALYIISQYRSESEDPDSSAFFVQNLNPESGEFTTILNTSGIVTRQTELRLNKNNIFMKSEAGYSVVRF